MKLEHLTATVTEDDPDRPRIILAGEMDVAATQIGPYLVERMKANPDAEWHVDLSGVTFVDSSGLRILLQIRRALGDDGSVVIDDPSPQALSILRMSKLDFFFDVQGVQEPESSDD